MRKCAFVTSSQMRDSRAHPGAGLGREGDSLLSQSAAVRLLFLDHHPFWVVHLICIHLFPAEEAFSSLRRSLTISQNPAASSHYLLRNENTAMRRRKKKKRMKRKEKGEGRKQKGGGKGNTFFSPKQKPRAGIKESTVCVCALFSTLPWKRAPFCVK